MASQNRGLPGDLPNRRQPAAGSSHHCGPPKRRLRPAKVIHRINLGGRSLASAELFTSPLRPGQVHISRPALGSKELVQPGGPFAVLATLPGM